MNIPWIPLQVVRGAAASLMTIVLGAHAIAAPTITIVAPTEKKTVHDNRGQLSVTVRLTERGSLPDDIGFQAVLDGKPVGDVHRARSFVLSGINRGAHRLRVQLLDRGGRVLATSPNVEFYMWQASRLFPSQQ